MQVEQEFTEQDLYFGSKINIAYLKRVKGQCYKYQAGDIFQHTDRNSVQSALQYRLPLAQLGQEYEKVIVPCIPACDLYTKYLEYELQESNNQSELKKNQLLTLNEIVSCCFIKVSKDQDYDTIAFQSGKRSAIVKTVEGVYIRLKGCGNLDQGFPLEKSSSKYPEAYEPRGCQFNHTAKREIYVSNQVSQFLQLINNESAIKPLGFYLYNENFEQDQSFCPNLICLKNDAKLIRKYSTVFETLGEKRLSTHLLQGLSQLLRGALRQTKKENTQYKQIQSSFPQERIIPNDQDLENGIYQVEENMMELLDVVQREKLLEEETFPIEKEGLYLNLYQNLFHTKKQLNSEKINFQNLFESLQVKLIYQGLFSQITANLNDIDFNQLVLQISLIYGRVGWELGSIMRSFYQNKLNWGYYADHDSAFHCNAHPNNFVVLPQGHANLIAPLDFDMAFFEEEFININNNEPTYGQNDKQLFNKYMELGRQSLELALSGLEIMSNFQFETQNNFQEEPEVQLLYSLYIQAFRDTLRIYYMRGFENRSCDISILQLNSSQFNQIHDIIKLSLLLTCEEKC
ncbi:hypothetical protein TTHERM_00048820 (macronuclear) [Tetrahymena thermophila SB210]|uniref:Uncharacterized protein n=1 Tax=Tetrahymena thermophila (strain SB210) TaxID=312017 RepID=Q23DA8_TETTS|nr:hypothetical protein TTHERM_00048820 [Tetrahymena thermophila SB210]EAR94379.1 hypothetical protein TTHERM_00048820 [Tetrahymena thermophila SB210]|eukprot:XP_001014778.1 hypothetical protein TTHERM_00048820 [Tetrahymena thermophila SB210]